MIYFAAFACGFFVLSALACLADLLRSEPYPREREPDTLRHDLLLFLLVLPVAIWGVLAVVL